MTYLELVNDVLVRLRESTVSTVGETTYSSLIGKFVNDAKRQIEDAYTWNCLSQTVTVTTTSGTSSYSLTGVGQKFRVIDAINTTSLVSLTDIPFVDMNRKLNFGSPAQSIPTEYCFNGVDGSGDTKVSLFPVPNGVFTLLFDVVVPQAALSSDSTSVKVLDYLVAQSAYARALIERGEDGGTSSSEAYALFRGMLSDAIATESTRYPEESNFEAV
jgi:hypothetical protein